MLDTDTPRKEDDPQDLSRDGDRDKDKERNAKAKGSAKAKDLSHVPCKFFKVGSCTAGSSCPFSHTILEPGQAKEVCAWFVKGNCKFGHKCALAHILPGQSMSMDRKNKKAAQAAASAANSAGRDGQRTGRSQKGASQGSRNGSSAPRNPLLSGSTAPTRSLSSSRSVIPMPLKATLSPSAPAPPVQNTDFASFGLPDETNKLPNAPAQGKTSTALVGSVVPPSDHTAEPDMGRKSEELSIHHEDAAEHSLVASASRSQTPEAETVLAPSDFSPEVSPGVATMSTSPFSAPGSQSIFMAREQQRSVDFKARSGLSASLGAMKWGAADMHGAGVGRGRYGGTYALQDEVVVEDGELEEFIPGSLSDLLTPEERSRRFSRTNVTRPAAPALDREGAGSREQFADGPHHRHSRSVPAPSLLQDIRSIWTDNSEFVPGSEASLNSIGVTTGGLGNGTPSSFQSNSGFGDTLAPSNASAAFLPGLHHYMSAKTSQRTSIAPSMASLHTSSAVLTSHHLQGFATLDNVARSPPRTGTFAAGTTYDGRSADLYLTQAHRHARPIPSGHEEFDGELDRVAFSPGTRALQAHAPGQSLPQGLAAGYSRIHALPPPTVASPSSTMAFSPGHSTGLSPGPKSSSHLSGASADWNSAITANDQAMATSSGLESMFSRLSYSAAASRQGTAPANGTTRPVNGRGWQNNQGSLSSPLSGPVVTGDDDDLFSMDG